MHLSQSLICIQLCMVVSCFLPVEIWLHTSNFHKLTILSVFSHEKGPMHMVKKKHRQGQMIAVSQCSSLIQWCGIITCFACQDLASHMNISQITFFFCIFSGKKTLAHGETKKQIYKLMHVSQDLIFKQQCGIIACFACQDFASRMKI